MLRTAALCASVALPLAAFAAPVPPPSEKELLAKHWGKAEGQGEFSLKGKQLTLRTTGQPARGGINRTQMNMPRVTRTASGDFEATVKLVDAPLPDPKVKHDDSWPATRAGLYVEGGGYTVELHLYQYYPKFNGEQREEATRYLWVDTWFPRGGAGSSLKQVPAGQSVYLRLTRKGKEVTVSHSADGEAWSKPFNPRQQLELPDEVTVGVFFSHSTYQILDATFDGLKVEKLKEEKEKPKEEKK